jgi:O-antigen ligase
LQTLNLLSKTIFGALVGTIVLTAVPYGTAEPWWKAAFVCGIFLISIVAVIEISAGEFPRFNLRSPLLPMLALAALAYLQTFGAISADPYQTRFFVLQLLALTAFLALLYRYAATEARVRILVFAVVGVAVASAVFGILRQTSQQQHIGFVLPLLRPHEGFAQFINKNHFAYLMEMAFGLLLGIMLAGGVKRDRLLVCVAALLPIWTGLILTNSRGGILAMMIQVLIGALVVQTQFVQTAKLAIARVVLIVFLVAGVLIGTAWIGGDRLLTSFEPASGDSSAAALREGASRNEIWRATLKMFGAHPLLGAGMGGYWIAITAFHDASGALTPQEAHNDYLELLSSGGVVGLALGVWFAVSVIRLTRRNLTADRGFIRAVRLGAVLAIAGVAAHSLVDFGLHIIVNAVVFVTLIMMATASIDNSRRYLKK